MESFVRFNSRSKINFYQWLWICPFTVLLAFLLIIEPPLSLIIIAFILLFLTISYRLDLGILFSIFLFFLFYRFEIQYVSPTKKFADVLTLSTIPILIVYSMWLFRRFTGADNRTCKNYINKLIIFFTVWGILSLFWTRDVIHGVDMTIEMLINLMIVQLFTVYLSSREDMNILFKFLIGLGCVLGFYTIVSKFYYSPEIIINIHSGFRLAISLGGETFEGSKAIRAGGFAMSDAAAFALNFFIFIALSFLVGIKEKRKRIISLLVLCYLLLCAVLIGSKGGLGGLVIGLYFALLINPMIKKRRITWYFFITFLLILSIVFNVVILGEGRVTKSFSGGMSSKIALNSLTSRLDIWEIGFKKFYETYGVGFGIGTSAAEAKTLPHMHSFFFSALFDLGFIGFAFYMGIILKVIVELYKKISASENIFMKNILCCLFGALIAAMIQGSVISEYSFNFFWVIIGVIVAMTTKPFSLNMVGEKIISSK